jgi:hypothetical protein
MRVRRPCGVIGPAHVALTEDRMLKTLILAVSLAAFAGSPALAAPCKDAKGKFVKCAPKTMAAPKRCKDAKGKFVKCGIPGARPA